MGSPGMVRPPDGIRAAGPQLPIIPREAAGGPVDGHGPIRVPIAKSRQVQTIIRAREDLAPVPITRPRTGDSRYELVETSFLHCRTDWRRTPFTAASPTSSWTLTHRRVARKGYFSSLSGSSGRP